MLFYNEETQLANLSFFLIATTLPIYAPLRLTNSSANWVFLALCGKISSLYNLNYFLKKEIEYYQRVCRFFFKEIYFLQKLKALDRISFFIFNLRLKYIFNTFNIFFTLSFTSLLVFIFLKNFVANL